MPGTLASGGGRSEMSSPGKASWCICVRMSPGSMVSTRRSGSLGGEHPADVVERRLGGAVAAPALVGLDRGVRRDVDDDGAGRPGGATPPGSGPSGATTLTVNSSRQRIERVLGQRRAAATARARRRC